VDPETRRPRGVQVAALNAGVSSREVAEVDAFTEGIENPRDRFRAEVDRIFGHPYDSNWWVPTVQEWASRHKYVLAQYIRDRNAGRTDVH
jgi:hypothetical protein